MQLSPEDRLSKGDHCRHGAIEWKKYGKLQRAAQQRQHAEKRSSAICWVVRPARCQVHRNRRASRNFDGSPRVTYDFDLKNFQIYAIGALSGQVIGLDDLIRIKQHVNRFKDSESLDQLLSIKQTRDEARQK